MVVRYCTGENKRGLYPTSAQAASGGQTGKCPLNTLVTEATETCVKPCI